MAVSLVDEAYLAVRDEILRGQLGRARRCRGGDWRGSSA